jgi:uncharacterized membrane protein YhaH (DUF805 family)
MSFIEAVRAYFVEWNNFKTRSSRSEYWWATLFVFFAGYLVGLIIEFFIGFTFAYAEFSDEVIMTLVGITTLIVQVFIFIASTALVVRRLHDIDKSGWWYLLIFTIIGFIPLLIWFCTKGSDGRNRFGENPLEKDAEFLQESN